MSKEIHPTQQAYADGVKYGKELCALPWRKPEERPERVMSDILAISKSSRGELSFEIAYAAVNLNKEYWGAVVCWCYADELPLPEWVQK